MKKCLKAVLLASGAVMFLRGLSVQAMEPFERDSKKLKLETNITTNNSEEDLRVNISDHNEISTGIKKEPSAAEKLKKEQKLHECRKKFYYKFGLYVTPFKTLSAQLSCIWCEVGDKFSFDTPFGRVNCEKREGRDGDNYYINPGEEGTKYRDIVRVVNKMIKRHSKGSIFYARKIKYKISNTILNYISMPADERIRTLQEFGEIRFNEVTDITGCSPTEQKKSIAADALIFSKDERNALNALAVLSALMMLSEPARNQMGGKYERAAIREWRDDPDPMSMEKIFDNDTFRGEEIYNAKYKMSLPGGKRRVNDLVHNRTDDKVQKETFESLNKSISFNVDCDADVVHQSK